MSQEEHDHLAPRLNRAATKRQYLLKDAQSKLAQTSNIRAADVDEIIAKERLLLEPRRRCLFEAVDSATAMMAEMQTITSELDLLTSDVQQQPGDTDGRRMLDQQHAILRKDKRIHDQSKSLETLQAELHGDNQ